MKVLWLCNIMIPAIAKSLGLPYSNREGWLTGIYERMRQEEHEKIELGICFPVDKGCKSGRVHMQTAVCYAFEEDLSAPERYAEDLEEEFRRILADFQPDMVHIFGTEFPHTLAMVKAFGRPERTLVGIQGLCFACAGEYMADIPEYVQNRVTFRDWLKKDSIKEQQEKFMLRGEHEIEALKMAGHITGRTEFDRQEVKRLNDGALYHFMNETMREPFYRGKWNIEECEPYSIFLSQGDYPLKGFHYVLRAMSIVLESCPATRIYVAGNSITDKKTIKDRIKLSSYGKYLLELIKENHLEDKVEILGRLTAEEMKEQFLKSSVFVCPSSIENSPNSIGEAMLLGVPVVAAKTGGIPSLIEDESEGLLYPAGNVDKLAEAILRVWTEQEKTLVRAEAARNRAIITHDADINYRRLLEIYREICV